MLELSTVFILILLSFNLMFNCNYRQMSFLEYWSTIFVYYNLILYCFTRCFLLGQVERKSLSAWKDVSDYQGDSVHVVSGVHISVIYKIVTYNSTFVNNKLSFKSKKIVVQQNITNWNLSFATWKSFTVLRSLLVCPPCGAYKSKSTTSCTVYF